MFFQGVRATKPELYGLAFLAFLKIAIHLFFINQYDLFRDEFYYIACSERLAWGYVDQPPLSIFLLKLNRLLLGDSLLALRLPVVLIGGAVVVLTGSIARELGAGVFGVLLAALAAVVAPIYLGFNKFYSMNAFDVFFWAWALLLVLRLLKNPERRALWIWLGFVLGLGLLNKHSILFFGFGLFVGLLATKHRRMLLSAGPYLAGGLAFVIFAPHLWWQLTNDAPTLEFMTNARLHKNTAFSPAGFIGGLVLEMHPLLAPLWLIGLGYLLFAKRLEDFRPAGILFLSLLLLFMFTGGKTYYLAAAFPVLLAAGGFAVESFEWRAQTTLRVLIVSLILIGGAVIAPLALPILPIRTFIAYQDFLGISPPANERHDTGVVPQHFADMFGWRELTAGVARVLKSLPAQERQRVTILAGNYGFAGALEFFGRQYDLPRTVSGHNNHYLWGYGESDLDPVIAVGFDEAKLRELFSTVEIAGTVACEFCLPNRQESRIFICRGLKLPATEAWKKLKRFI